MGNYKQNFAIEINFTNQPTEAESFYLSLEDIYKKHKCQIEISSFEGYKK